MGPREGRIEEGALLEQSVGNQGCSGGGWWCGVNEPDDESS